MPKAERIISGDRDTMHRAIGTAFDFHLSMHRCLGSETTPTSAYWLPLSADAIGAFAIEIYLKVLSMADRGQYQAGHDLLKLYQALSDDDRIVTAANYRAMTGQEILEHLDLCKSDFEALRYRFEVAEADLHLREVIDISTCLFEHMLSRVDTAGRQMTVDNIRHYIRENGTVGRRRRQKA